MVSKLHEYYHSVPRQPSIATSRFCVKKHCVQFHFVDVLVGTIKSVLTDEAFEMPSPPATAARRNADIAIDWYASNHQPMEEFAQQLFVTLEFYGLKKNSSRKDRMWEQYYHQRSSDNFAKNWTSFLLMSGAKPFQTLYQHVTDIAFNHLITLHFPSTTNNIQIIVNEII